MMVFSAVLKAVHLPSERILEPTGFEPGISGEVILQLTDGSRQGVVFEKGLFHLPDGMRNGGVIPASEKGADL